MRSLQRGEDMKRHCTAKCTVDVSKKSEVKVQLAMDFYVKKASMVRQQVLGCLLELS